MKTLHQFIITLSLLTALFLQNASAQDYAKSNLPEGAKLRIGKGTLGEIAYFSDGTRFAVATSVGVWIYDSITGKELYQLTDHTNGVGRIYVSPDGKTFAVTDTHNSIVEIWDVELGKILNSFSGHLSHPYCGGGTITTVRYSTSGETIASGSTDKTVRLWNTTTNKHLKTFSGHTDRISSVAFSPDGKTLASGSNDGTILLWEVP